MKRLGFLAGAVLALAACATVPSEQSAPQQGFSSDRVSVLTRGTGPDVILIPGLSSSRHVWNTTADALDDNYRVHLVQLNGFAGTPVGGAGEGLVSRAGGGGDRALHSRERTGTPRRDRPFDGRHDRHHAGGAPS